MVKSRTDNFCKIESERKQGARYVSFEISILGQRLKQNITPFG